MHTYHNGLDNYDERQILHDLCPECEYRGQNIHVALAHMDDSTFARAWKRAHDWQHSKGDHESVGPIANAEAELLKVLYGIQVQLERMSSGV